MGHIKPASTVLLLLACTGAPQALGAQQNKGAQEDMIDGAGNVSFIQMKPFLAPLLKLQFKGRNWVLHRPYWETALKTPLDHPYAGDVQPEEKEKPKDDPSEVAPGKGGDFSWKYLLEADTPVKKLFARASKAVAVEKTRVIYTNRVNKTGEAAQQISTRVDKDGKQTKYARTYTKYSGGDQNMAGFNNHGFAGRLTIRNHDIRLTFFEELGRQRSVTLEDNNLGGLRITCHEPNQNRTLIFDQEPQGNTTVIHIDNTGAKAVTAPSTYALITQHSGFWDKKAAAFLAELNIGLPDLPKDPPTPRAPAKPQGQKLKGLPTFKEGIGKIALLDAKEGLRVSRGHWYNTKILRCETLYDTFDKNRKLKRLPRYFPYGSTGNSLDQHFIYFSRFFFQISPRYENLGYRSIHTNMYTRQKAFFEQNISGRLLEFTDPKVRRKVQLKGIKKGFASTNFSPMETQKFDLLLQDHFLWGDTLHIINNYQTKRVVLFWKNTAAKTTLYLEQFPNRQTSGIFIKDGQPQTFSDHSFTALFSKERDLFEKTLFPSLAQLNINTFDIYSQDVQDTVLTNIWVVTKEDLEAFEEYLDMLDSEDPEEQKEAHNALLQGFRKYQSLISTHMKDPNLTVNVADALKKIHSQKTMAYKAPLRLALELNLANDLPYLAFLLSQEDSRTMPSILARLKAITSQDLGKDPQVWKNWFAKQK